MAPVMQHKREQAHLTYIPISSFVILLVILLTCASRRRKVDPFNTAEESLENDIKGDYAIMCFPCLKKKPQLRDYQPTADLSDQFEYIVEKYTIRKVPLLLANTTEDIIERQEELQMAEVQQIQPELIKDDLINFQYSQDECNIVRGGQCITVAANTICPARKSARDKSMPSDILESMSPITRPNVKNANYVVIPTKGSLRNKDIMMTKREITNQYLNNFSSVFVDNLKDQIPKDPEQFPNLSRPYTSAFKNLPLTETMLKAKATPGKRIKGSKIQKVAYTFPSEIYEKEENYLKEEDHYYESDSGSKDLMTDAQESEFQEDDMVDMNDKSLPHLNDTDSGKESIEGTVNPFKTTIKSSMSMFGNNETPSYEDCQSTGQKDDWTGVKVTYEDIQALDVGYEFSSCEKLGVKPKMTRIHCPLEADRGKDLKQIGDPKSNRKSFYMSSDQPQLQLSNSKMSRAMKQKQHQRSSDVGCFSFLSAALTPPKEIPSAKSVVNETSFLPPVENSTKESGIEGQGPMSTSTSTSKSESKSQSLNDIDMNGKLSEPVNSNVAEISKLYDLAMPVPGNQTKQSENLADDTTVKYPSPSKSRSLQEPLCQGGRKDAALEVKGKDSSTLPSTHSDSKTNRLNEPETETSCTILSRDSKSSSMLTSSRSIDREEGKRATLRWKIVIKHHRDDDASRKHVNKNIKL
ncbi:hypothetical protein RUM43_009514 [Polyplax serrata]|uniref:Uncharacterized protein n=1 Tax=Polyplax serrata TaxID=468196 RepID=A0AAN8PD66_POLSC